MNDDGKVYSKFRISRTDSSHLRGRKHYGCEYFVLDVTHDPYAMSALRAYARACKKTHPELADDIRSKWLEGGAG